VRFGTILAILSLLTACVPSASPTAPSSAPPSAAAASVAPSGPPTIALEDRLEAEIAIAGADFPVVAFDSVWVVRAEVGTDPAIIRVDPETNQIAAEILVPGRGCNGAAAGFDAIWACSSDGIARIDPATNSVATVIPVDAIGEAYLATGAGSVWAFTQIGDAVVPDAVLRIDPATNSVLTTIGLDHPTGTMAFGFDALWVTSPEDGLLLRVDPATNQVTTVVDGLEQPFTVAAGPDSLWVSLYADSLYADDQPAPAAGDPIIVRIDPETGEITASIPIAPVGRIGDIAADETSVWVRGPDAFLTHINPATNEVVEIIAASKAGGGVALGFGSVWAASFDFAKIWRVSP
jgi:virginiamycin B lyase